MILKKAKQTSYAEYLNDLLFIIRYPPKAMPKLIKYAFCGAIIGYTVAYLRPHQLSNFAKQHHDAVDITGEYVADENQFLHASRDVKFNQVTTPISTILPGYAAAIGAGAGFFAGILRSRHEMYQQLEADRELRSPLNSLV